MTKEPRNQSFLMSLGTSLELSGTVRLSSLASARKTTKSLLGWWWDGLILQLAEGEATSAASHVMPGSIVHQEVNESNQIK